jgi:hypothetical protein
MVIGPSSWNSSASIREALLACFLLTCVFATPAQASTSSRSTPQAPLTAFYQ